MIMKWLNTANVYKSPALYKHSLEKERRLVCVLCTYSQILGQGRDFGGKMDYLPAPQMIWSRYWSFKHALLDLIIPHFSFPFTFWHWCKAGGRIYCCWSSLTWLLLLTKDNNAKYELGLCWGVNQQQFSEATKRWTVCICTRASPSGHPMLMGFRILNTTAPTAMRASGTAVPIWERHNSVWEEKRLSALSRQ